jgi:transcriptional regulator with XRE-family HTH domain
MTQQDFADYLGVSRALLSLAEMNQRELPAKASKRMEELQANILNAGKNPGKVMKDKESKIKIRVLEAVKQKLRGNERKLKTAENALSKLQLEHTRATYVLANIETFGEKAKPISVALFKVLADNAEILYDASGEDTWLNSELRIEALKAENAFLRKKLKELGDE